MSVPRHGINSPLTEVSTQWLCNRNVIISSWVKNDGFPLLFLLKTMLYNYKCMCILRSM